MQHTSVNIENIRMLPKVITDYRDLEEEFRELFDSAEARSAIGVTYIFRSILPIPRIRGYSDILYIGKTKQSLRNRYFRYSETLALGENKRFYQHIIDNFGGIRLGYFIADDPRALEVSLFNEYRSIHLENPPKSKVG